MNSWRLKSASNSCQRAQTFITKKGKRRPRFIFLVFPPLSWPSMLGNGTAAMHETHPPAARKQSKKGCSKNQAAMNVLYIKALHCKKCFLHCCQKRAHQKEVVLQAKASSSSEPYRKWIHMEEKFSMPIWRAFPMFNELTSPWQTRLWEVSLAFFYAFEMHSICRSIGVCKIHTNTYEYLNSATKKTVFCCIACVSAWANALCTVQ